MSDETLGLLPLFLEGTGGFSFLRGGCVGVGAGGHFALGLFILSKLFYFGLFLEVFILSFFFQLGFRTRSVVVVQVG